MPQPALRQERDVEGGGDDTAAGDEEGLELVGTDGADVGQRHARLHGRVVLLAGVDDPVEEHAQQHS